MIRMAISLRFATRSFRPAISRNGKEATGEEARGEVISGVSYRDEAAGRQLAAMGPARIYEKLEFSVRLRHGAGRFAPVADLNPNPTAR
jgi:hypothetical protein